MSKDLIDEVHDAELDLLEKFDSICSRLNLTYTLSSGTLLGAVRHGGFIPWDDDIDVSMVRADYEIFIREANEILPDGYFVQHYTTEKECPNVFAKLRNSNTTWITYEHKNLNINHGIGMDIFPIDRVDDPAKLKEIKRKTAIWTALKNCYDIEYIKTIKNKFKKAVGYFVHPLSKMMQRKKIIKKQDEFNKGNGCGEWTTADLIKRDKLLPYDIFEEYEDIIFENKKFKCIKNKERYLTIVYGENYMTLPPIDKRVVHLVETVDCNTPYVLKIKQMKAKEK